MSEAMTLEQWSAYVEESNARFFDATKEEKRVMLAEDVLKQLKAGRIMPTSTYLGVDPGTDIYVDTELRDVLKGEKSCHVCGIGALFISAVGRLDELTSRVFFETDPQRAIRRYMSAHDLFSAYEMRIVEYFFESFSTGLDRTEHMEIIMHAIIDSKGAPIDDSFKLRLYDTATKNKNSTQEIADGN